MALAAEQLTVIREMPQLGVPLPGTEPPGMKAISPFIDASAQASALDPEILRRLAFAEGQYDPATGTWKSSGTHLGPMQVGTATFQDMLSKPGTFSTAQGLTDLTSPAQNVAAGAASFASLLSKYGDLTLAILAYHDGPGAIDAVLAGQGQPSQAGLDEARKVLAGYGGTGFGPAGATTAPPAARPVAATGIPSELPGVGAEPSGFANTLQGTMDQVDALYKSASEFQRIGLEAQIEQFTKFRDSVGASSDAGQHASAVIQDLQVKLGALRDPLTEQEKMAQTARDAVAPLTAEAGAARDLLAVVQRYQEFSRDTHQPIDEIALATSLAAEQSKLTGAFHDGVRQIDLQAASQERLTPLLALGGQAAEFAGNHEKALTDARKTSVPGTAEYARQVAVETAALDRSTRAKTDNAAATDFAKLSESSRLIAAATGLIGADTAERNRRITVLQEEIKLGIQDGDVLTEQQRRTLDLVAANADLRTAMQQRQQDMNEMANSFTQSFDTIGNAITQSPVLGQGAAVNWQNVMSAVVQQVLQQFLKLAVLNPLLNTLFPGSQQRSTLSSVFDTLQGQGGTILGAAGNSGFLGNVRNLFPAGSGIASFFTGGVSDSSLLLASQTVGTFLHGGGRVGHPAAGTARAVLPVALWADAPRYHAGLGADEMAPVLLKGERVLTPAQNDRTTALLNRLTDRVANSQGGHTFANHFNLPNVRDVDTFRRSAPQIAQRALATASTAARRNG
jgi:hypothetical protein